MSKTVAVILLNWNTPDYTSNCISSLLTHCSTSLFDIIVADNGSTDGSLSILQKKFPNLIYINNKENLGFAAGNNRALIYANEKQYTYSILLNTDTETDEDFITPLFEFMESNQAVAAVQPAIYWLNDPKKLWNGGSYFNEILGITYSKNKPVPKPEIKSVDWITGCCFMLRNNVLEHTGLLNEKFFLYYEDVELSMRIKKHGFDLKYYPFVKIFHEAGASGKKPSKENEGIVSPIIHYYNARNRIWNLRKNGNPIFIPVNFLYSLIYYGSILTYFIIRRRFKKASLMLKGISDGLFTPSKEIWSLN